MQQQARSWQVVLRVEKWHTEEDYYAGRAPYEVIENPGNVLCTAGITRLLNLLVGAGGQAYDATHTRIGVGDSLTAATAADTDLGAAAGAAHRFFSLVDIAPSVAGNVVTFHTTVGSADGNFTWNEWGIDNGTASGTVVSAPLLNHKVQALGTKAAGLWALTASITIS